MLTAATLGTTDLVEDLHRRIVHPPFLPSTPIQELITGIAGVTYQSIRGTTRLVGRGLDHLAGQLAPVLGPMNTDGDLELLRAVLNGVIGDYLEAEDNPLQIALELRHELEALVLETDALTLRFPAASGTILVLVHGLCMNDAQWTRDEHNHGTALADALGATPLYLRYNSGRHISTNGQAFSVLLEDLVAHWPVPVERLLLVAHSMGGLVARSAMHYGQQAQQRWPQHLQKIVFLGTPHHGAPLERMGNYFDTLLSSIPYTKPFARLGKIRSAGVTDLRYGNLLDEDWQGRDRFDRQGDPRQPVPLPSKIACYSMAATVGTATHPEAARVLGDSLVNVNSALGQHSDPSKTLHFEEARTWISYETNHFELLSKEKVYAVIRTWLEEDNA